MQLLASVSARFARAFKKPERFLVSEFSPHAVRVSACRVDFGERTFEIEESFSVSPESGDAMAVFRAGAAVISRMKRYRKRRVVCAMDSRFATTIRATAAVERAEARAELRQADLDHYIANAVWRLFDSVRSEASAKMGVRDLDVAPADARVIGTAIDGHKVVSPVGFTGRKLGITLTETCAPLRAVQAVTALFPDASAVSFVEDGIAEGGVLAYAEQERSFVFVHTRAHSADIFLCDEEERRYLDSVPWGEARLLGHLEATFKLSRDGARHLLYRYLNGDTSPHVFRKLDREMRALYEELYRALLPHVREHGATLVYLFLAFARPGDAGAAVSAPEAEIFGAPIAEYVTRAFRRRTACAIADPAALFSRMEFSVSPGYRSAPGAFLAYAAIAEFHFSPGDATMSTLAKRHARWLFSQKNEV